MFLHPAPSAVVLAAVALLSAPAAAGPLASSKRGLVFTPNASHPQDNYIWTRKPSDLTWYYNYQGSPSPVFNNLSQAAFEFVPMIWGAPADVSDTTFLTTVTSLIKDKGINISSVLTFNEPDGLAEWGSSDIQPSVAAQVWVNQIIPLQALNVRVGLPACTGGYSGVPWLQQFLGNCSKLISSASETKNCTYDFITLHWYGNFEGLASHIGTYAAAFPNKTMWITEYNFDNQDLATSQSFYNTSAEYLDRLDYVERYSLFGAFRSDVSNVGPNGAMLSAGGQLTDIGAWYLGRQGTGVSPQSTSTGKSSGTLAYAPRVGTMLTGALFVTALLSF
ncbi:alkali-sensitive linkage protein 1 [Diplogelasinospora grovesii]|uniref:Alkali-sensitive linkage protein 1 n=1 Tax=Diplogelasinospora grovesii TaxID=303347 RepID=A0AAN6RZT4_9PEZI|nr:alkali-sensitive linkage protein 1 [Diplogelasinospora grovesii]